MRLDSLKAGLCKHWDKIVHMPFSDAVKLGLREKDAEFFDALGLPAWVAPNMHFHIPSLFSDSAILVGEDRDDRKLIYEKVSGKILVAFDDGGNLLAAPDFPSLLSVLIDYADMVEEAIATVGSRACLDNKIPDRLIDSFEASVLVLFGNVDSIWGTEIARLRSHTPN